MAKRVRAALIGAGRMGGALLERWLEAGFEGSEVLVVDPNPGERTQAAVKKHGARLEAEWPEGVEADVVMMGVKPQMMDKVGGAVAGKINEDAVILSIAAGRTLESLQAVFGNRGVIRVMPNTPVAIGAGVCGFVCADNVTDDQKAKARSVLEPGGFVAEVETENQLDALTAVSGSGPAYIFLFAEALAGAARAQDLPEELASQLAQQTVIGAALFMQAEGKDPADMRKEVTSPGGTTAAALDVLSQNTDTLPRLVRTAVDAAARKAKELGR